MTIRSAATRGEELVASGSLADEQLVVLKAFLNSYENAKNKKDPDDFEDDDH
jgi:hypothetical protein